MEVLRPLGLLSVVMFSVLLDQSSTTDVQCVSNCRMMDADLDSCWRGSLEFHATELVAKTEVLASALLHVNHWRRSNSDTPSLSDESSRDNNSSHTNEPLDQTLEHEVIDSVLSRLNNDSTLPEETIRAILLLVLNGVTQVKSRYELSDQLEEPEKLPPLSCPVTCDYYPRTWVALFVVTAIGFALFAVTVLLYFGCAAWRPYRKFQSTLISANES